jgi:hypothetical protein
MEIFGVFNFVLYINSSGVQTRCFNFVAQCKLHWWSIITVTYNSHASCTLANKCDNKILVDQARKYFKYELFFIF